MIDPRTSDDPLVRKTLAIWDRVNDFRKEADAEATELIKQLRFSNHHQAFGWAALTRGRIAACREDFDLAESLLTEALGRFILVGDAYGKTLAISHLAIPQTRRGQLDRGLELALEPLQSNSGLMPLDLAMMHNTAAMCYSEREELSAAVFHLNNEMAIVKKVGDESRQHGVISNIGVLLARVGEFKLARDVLLEGWRLEQEREVVIYRSCLRALICVCSHLDRTSEALEFAQQLIERIAHTSSPDLSAVVYGEISEALARAGRVDDAREYLDRARALCDRSSVRIGNELLGNEAIILEMSGHLDAAIQIAKKLVASDSMSQTMGSSRRQAAATLSRCYAKLGDKKLAEYWLRYRQEIGSSDQMLGSLLTNQIRANFQIKETPRTTLTDKELTCLRLSANGQTSTDIGLKLGITPRTVNFHFSKILRKLNAMNRQEAIAKAASANLLR